MRCNEVHEAAWRRPLVAHVGLDDRKRRSHSEEPKTECSRIWPIGDD